jgi:hypothetical protein
MSKADFDAMDYPEFLARVDGWRSAHCAEGPKAPSDEEHEEMKRRFGD